LFSKRLYIIIFLLASSWALQAQEGVIHVLDAESNKPVEFVHLIFRDLKTKNQQVSTTDVNGKSINLAEGPTYLVISFIGYSPIHEQIEAGKSYEFKLERGTEGLDEVVVTAQYAPTTEANSVFKVRLINAAQIESRGAITLNQLLNDQLNIRIQQDNSTGSGLSMEGLSDNNIKILIDGVPVTGRLNGNIDLSQINLDNIERVEIIEGPMSVMYGSNALGGTINLISKKPKKNQFDAGAKFYYESVGAYNTNVYSTFGNPKNSATLNVGRNFFDGWSPTQSLRWQQWKQKEQYFGTVGYTYNFKNWNLGFKTDGLWEQIKDKGERRSEFSNYAFDNWYTTNRWMNTLTSDINGIKNHKLNVIGSYTWFNRTKLRYNRDLVNLSQELTTNPEDHDTTNINTFLMRATLSSGFAGKLNYQLGTDLNWENTTGGRVDGSPEMGDYALFASLNWQATQRLVVQPAMRYGYNTQFSSPIVPSINFQYKVDEKWQLRLSLANGFRAPSLKEMYLDFVDINHNITGNPNLTPENSRHAHLYFTWNETFSETQQLKIEPSLFYNQLKNMIALTQVQGTEYTYLNIDEYTTFGGKIQLSYNIHPDFNFKAGYAYLAYSNRFQSEDSPENFQYSPEFTASFNYWRAQQKFRFNVIYKFTGAVPSFIAGADGQATQTLIPSYNLLDVTASYGLWKNRILFSAGVKNLFDVTNLTVANGGGGVHSGGDFSAVSWGRSYFLSLKVSM